MAMVSPWMDNGTLLDYLRRVPKTDRWKLCVDVSEGLAYLHANDVKHGDMKSMNVLVSREGVAKVSDFGCTELKNNALVFTATNSKPGTARWSSPKKMVNGTPSMEDDVYALGLVLLEIITGEVPFSHLLTDVQLAWAKAIHKEVPLRPTEFPTFTADEANVLWKIALDTWSYEPSSRPNAETVASRLKDIRGMGQELDVTSKLTVEVDFSEAELPPTIPAQGKRRTIRAHTEDSFLIATPYESGRTLEGQPSTILAAPTGIIDMALDALGSSFSRSMAFEKQVPALREARSTTSMELAPDAARYITSTAPGTRTAPIRSTDREFLILASNARDKASPSNTEPPYPRERTRQVVLWEIVATEERYFAELIKHKETFIDPLLHPLGAPPPFYDLLLDDTTTIPDEDLISLRRAKYPAGSLGHLPIAARFIFGIPAPSPHISHRRTTSAGYLDHLPIAARFLAPSPSSTSNQTNTHAETTRPQSLAPTAGDVVISDSDDETKFGKNQSRGGTPSSARSPYRTTAQRRDKTSRVGVPPPVRSHRSPHPQPHAASSADSLGWKSVDGEFTGQRTVVSDLDITGLQLPEDLRICLEVLEDVILPGHYSLRWELQRRYEGLDPFVRNLVDIFVAHSKILEGYAKYVLHLERALDQVDNALASPSVTKIPRNQDAAQWARTCKALGRLEEVAADKAETGLAMSLSKPFQRLLKYPRLFQTLLFYTDPSAHEYESTLQMVAEVNRIVGSIGKEKAQKEERDRTWDVLARIEGLDKVRQLAVPKPSRMLISEEPLFALEPTTSENNRTPPSSNTSSPTPKNVKDRSSFKRLSDVLRPSSSAKKDVWLVTFNDVVLRCERVGTTTLPLVTGGPLSRPHATTGRRTAQNRPRNMYKFIRIETWAIRDVTKPRAGVVSMEELGAGRS